jgi:hypothetical protein
MKLVHHQPTLKTTGFSDRLEFDCFGACIPKGRYAVPDKLVPLGIAPRKSGGVCGRICDLMLH